jgi:hypothetical protein
MNTANRMKANGIFRSLSEQPNAEPRRITPNLFGSIRFDNLKVDAEIDG